MALLKQIAMRPAVQLVGDVNHSDFREAIDLLRTNAQIVNATNESPELIVIAQSRPGTISSREIEAMRRAMPLAGMVALVGSWGEGETRTGCPWPGVERQHWYEFPSWWRRQLASRAAGRCPDWARPGDLRFRICDVGYRNMLSRNAGLVVVRAAGRETADVLSDLLMREGYATAWQPIGRSLTPIHGAIAGVWEGGQLSDREADDLSAFCRKLANDGAPVVALLDFPRRDCVDRAREIGAAAVLGKPWLNINLIATLHAIVEQPKLARAA